MKILAKISEVTFVSKLEENVTSPVALFNQTRFMLKVEIDVEAEKLRLNREIEKLTKELDKINLKLNAPGFAEKAPKELVEKETARRQALDNMKSSLTQQLCKLN